MRASLIEKGIAQPVLPFAKIDQPEPYIPPAPPIPIHLRPPLPLPKQSSAIENVYHNEPTKHIFNKDVTCQTTPTLTRTDTQLTISTEEKGDNSTTSHRKPVIISQLTQKQHKIRQEELTVYYDQAPFYERFKIYQGYYPCEESKPLPVTFEPSVLCIHDNDSKTYESIQPSSLSPSSTEEFMSDDPVTCAEIKKHCCYYIFCCGMCCE